MQVLLCSVLNLFSRICPSVVKKFMERKIVESRGPGPGAARERQTDLEVCRLGLLTCLVLEVMVLHTK